MNSIFVVSGNRKNENLVFEMRRRKPLFSQISELERLLKEERDQREGEKGKWEVRENERIEEAERVMRERESALKDECAWMRRQVQEEEQKVGCFSGIIYLLSTRILIDSLIQVLRKK